MNNEVYFLRLKTGEDIISEITTDDSTYTLLNPCKVLYLKGKNAGFISISLMQWVFGRICKDQVFDIAKSEVMTLTIPNKSLIEHYHDSVTHFNETESKSEVEYESLSDEEFSGEDVDKGLELIKKLLDIKTDKGSLH